MSPHARQRPYALTGRSSAWLERLVWVQEVASSNLVAPMHLTERFALPRLFGADGGRICFAGRWRHRVAGPTTLTGVVTAAIISVRANRQFCIARRDDPSC